MDRGCTCSQNDMPSLVYVFFKYLSHRVLVLGRTQTHSFLLFGQTSKPSCSLSHCLYRTGSQNYWRMQSTLYFYKSETALPLVTIHDAVSTEESSSNNISNTISTYKYWVDSISITEHLKLFTKYADMHDAILATSHLPHLQSFTATAFIRHQMEGTQINVIINKWFFLALCITCAT